MHDETPQMKRNNLPRLTKPLAGPDISILPPRVQSKCLHAPEKGREEEEKKKA